MFGNFTTLCMKGLMAKEMIFYIITTAKIVIYNEYI